MTNTITNILNNFLKSQGYAENEVYAKFVVDEDSYYDESESVPYIVLGGMTNKKADEIFMKYCKETLGLVTEISVITLTFLHELGHHNTVDFLDNDELFESELTKMALACKGEETEEAFIKYFTCPIEMEATIDAVEFCNHCPEAAKKLDAAIQEALYV